MTSECAGEACCCRCRHHLRDMSHPLTDGGRVTEQRGWICRPPEGLGPFSGWPEHGYGCEMFESVGSKNEEAKVDAEDDDQEEPPNSTELILRSLRARAARGEDLWYRESVSQLAHTADALIDRIIAQYSSEGAVPRICGVWRGSYMVFGAARWPVRLVEFAKEDGYEGGFVLIVCYDGLPIHVASLYESDPLINALRRIEKIREAAVSELVLAEWAKALVAHEDRVSCEKEADDAGHA